MADETDNTWPMLARILARYEDPAQNYRSAVRLAAEVPQPIKRSAANVGPPSSGYGHINELLARAYPNASPPRDTRPFPELSDALLAPLHAMPNEAEWLLNFLLRRPSAAVRSPAMEVEPVPIAERWSNRPNLDQRTIDTAKRQGIWPDWAEQHPERALMSVKDQLASSAWSDVVNQTLFPNGGLRATVSGNGAPRLMERWEAEAQAMKTHPELGLAAQDARRAWLEHARGRPLTPGEMMWENLDRAPGVPPANGQELLNTYGRERFLAPGVPRRPAPRQVGFDKNEND